MKGSGGVPLLVWVVERMLPGRTGEAIAGDLLEELGAGRTAGWCCWQALLAVGRGTVGRAQPYAVVLLYSALWTALWPWIYARSWAIVLPGELRRWSALEWPYSSLLVVGGGELPTTSCVCLGVVLYLLLFSGRRAKSSAMRVVASVSLGLNVTLVGGVCLLAVPGMAPAGPHLAVGGPVALGGQSPAVAVPLMVGVWAAVVCAVRPWWVGDGRSSLPA